MGILSYQWFLDGGTFAPNQDTTANAVTVIFTEPRTYYPRVRVVDSLGSSVESNLDADGYPLAINVY
jgi:hypothetical protein